MTTSLSETPVEKWFRRMKEEVHPLEEKALALRQEIHKELNEAQKVVNMKALVPVVNFATHDFKRRHL